MTRACVCVVTVLLALAVVGSRADGVNPERREDENFPPNSLRPAPMVDPVNGGRGLMYRPWLGEFPVLNVDYDRQIRDVRDRRNRRESAIKFNRELRKQTSRLGSWRRNIQFLIDSQKQRDGWTADTLTDKRHEHTFSSCVCVVGQR
ncbi:unnamed protein product [Vitrella brassicaformis CCMP3155]|uniref:Secreted protein n=1 Tax=Vitrella brassicaformis (strain CCMP3155) TaxID=1169540 RepID=A0A0G4GZV3_VITBC|nr:unnamed protein product [Vitrella brassicaformis CCMP3155]|eukprot:CEM36618.1 unnamed protein product [Vitrella brassicaformis CCMP3155]